MDNSSRSANRVGNNRRPFGLGRGGRPNPFMSNQASASSPLLNFPALEVSPSEVTPLVSKLSTPVFTTTSPLHTREMVVNPQSASPLYDGHLPPEIRDHIFKYALEEYTKTGKESQYRPSTHYTRPGYTGKRAVTIPLLLTCRKTYLETYHLPPQKKEHVFWHERWPPHQNRYVYHADGQEGGYFSLFAPWQQQLVKEVHFFTQLYWLEDGAFCQLTKKAFMQGVEKVKITIRRGDWWHNEHNAPLGINPQRGDSDAAQMDRDWEATRRGEVIPWKEGGWGTAFANLASLQELEMEFETSEDKLKELEKIVEIAKTWKFPLKDGKVLTRRHSDL
ncbi:hypothetical protein D0Z07_0386 [Hyphodiscus hymeniophilus]|uniref:Uncharacterized protein n=1 Tax=Hyphodiscus hymeniophilus TaxID=353542 RepID=A0A9P6VST5_9HELO|nr:hypothetical protein D0Z07_0386 [Hyphodiscus hymeniophilus]